MDTSTHRLRRGLGAALILLLGLAAVPVGLRAEGSGSLYPAGATGFRANLEWRTSTYGGGLLKRRTLLKVYARAGEYIMLGSSAVDVPDEPDRGDILVFVPGRIGGPIGQEIVPAQPDYSCRAHRAQTGNSQQGRIASRLQETHGPDTIAVPATAQPGGAVPGGYVPCWYRATETGIYDIVFLGPVGDGSDSQIFPTGQLDHPSNFSAAQNTSVSAWDVTVRDSLTVAQSRRGRLFAYYLAMFTGGNGRPLSNTVYIVATDGFVYKVDLLGLDPNGYVLYGNQAGFLDSDGSPLYRNVMAVSTLPTQDQNQMVQLQGGVRLAPPQYPIFFDQPDPAALQAVGIPLTPLVPTVSGFSFEASGGGNVAKVGEGGTFRFGSNVGGVYELVISRDGQDWDPTSPQNRVLRGIRVSGGETRVPWDGMDNAGNAFPEGRGYQARTSVHGGEFHFPFLDVENSITGSPSFTLVNPPGGVCPLWNGSCSGALYDDRGYRTANGTIVGTAINGPLCPGNVGNPPDPLFSGPSGFDSTSGQRRFGFATGGNPGTICASDGGFGDKKGLDLWTYFPGNIVSTTLDIVADPTAITLVSFTATRQADGVLLRWETSLEQDTWGFHILRGVGEDPAGAARVTEQPILADGGSGGATYEWLDTSAAPGVAYRYWLEELTVSGGSAIYGPATVTTTSAAGAPIFMPLIGR